MSAAARLPTAGAALMMVAAAWAPRLLGCASCGSGGDDPMVLFPNEADKVYVGLTASSGFRNVDPDGSLSTAGGPATKDALTIAYGHACSLESFATVTVPFLRNSLNGESEEHVGDPSVAGRYTVLMPTMIAPWTPQVQLLAGYKPGWARSVHNTREATTLLDVVGTGFAEAKAGVDVWFGGHAMKFGGALTVLWPFAHTYDGVKYQPGMGSRTTASVAYDWTPMVKTGAGANLEERGKLRADGAAVADSQELNHSAFVTIDLMPRSDIDLRFSLAEQAAFGANKNTARSESFTAAFMRFY